MEVKTYFSWSEFGLGLKLEKLQYHSDYKYQLDMQFMFLNCWINFINK